MDSELKPYIGRVDAGKIKLSTARLLIFITVPFSHSRIVSTDGDGRIYLVLWESSGIIWGHKDP